jgi:2-(1,2-epoxy-1,2-dihydrophenyl)acetyl-CoA isomerase
MADEHVVVTGPRPGVALVTLDRPERRNALTARMMEDLAGTFAALGGDGRTRCVVLTGAPPAFCAGGDLAELRDGGEGYYATYCEAYRTIARAIRDMPCPLIAAVNGAAVAGGLELACLADLRIASADAFFAGGDARLGLPTTSGLSFILPRLVGLGRALSILYGDARIGAAEAQAIGLVEAVVAATEHRGRAIEMASKIAAMPGRGIELTRRTVFDALTQTHEEAMAAELEAQRAAFANPSVQRAFVAFFER